MDKEFRKLTSADDRKLLRRAAEHFGIRQDFFPIGRGHINDTYVSEDGRHVLQRINTGVFADPDALMDNIRIVTDHLYRKGLELGEDVKRSVLRFYPSDAGKLYVMEDGKYFRMMRYVSNSLVIEPGEGDPGILYECGRGFGRFLSRISDLDPACLNETIPRFHDTKKRVADLWDAVSKDSFHRAAAVRRELELVQRFEDRKGLILEGLAEGSIPLCVTHNDTKINNILFDAGSMKALCVIDLDTVMAGSRLYDYGDALRTAASAAGEDETDLEAIGVDREAFTAFTAGFLKELGEQLTERERSLLPSAFLLMTLECGIRFLEDHLRGDVYFKVSRPGHNLDRAKNQLRMAEQIEAELPWMEEQVRRLLCEGDCAGTAF